MGPNSPNGMDKSEISYQASDMLVSDYPSSVHQSLTTTLDPRRMGPSSNSIACGAPSSGNILPLVTV